MLQLCTGFFVVGIEFLSFVHLLQFAHVGILGMNNKLFQSMVEAKIVFGHTNMYTYKPHFRVLN